MDDLPAWLLNLRVSDEAKGLIDGPDFEAAQRRSAIERVTQHFPDVDFADGSNVTVTDGPRDPTVPLPVEHPSFSDYLRANGMGDVVDYFTKPIQPGDSVPPPLDPEELKRRFDALPGIQAPGLRDFAEPPHADQAPAGEVPRTVQAPTIGTAPVSGPASSVSFDSDSDSGSASGSDFAPAADPSATGPSTAGPSTAGPSTAGPSAALVPPQWRTPDPYRFAPQAQPPFYPIPPPPATPVLPDPNAGTNPNRISGRNAHYLRSRPPFNAQPPLGIPISMLEIATFFPNWFRLPDVILRAIRNGYKDHDVANMQLNAINHLTAAELKTTKDRLRKQISQGGKVACGMSDDQVWDSTTYRESEGPQNDLTADYWEMKEHWLEERVKDNFTHMKLLHIHQAVPQGRWPTGTDRLLLTRCLEFASNNTHLDLDTSHYNWIIQAQGWQVAVVPPGAAHDQNALARFHEAVADP